MDSLKGKCQRLCGYWFLSGCATGFIIALIVL
jgi:hypothetical protein